MRKTCGSAGSRRTDVIPAQIFNFGRNGRRFETVALPIPIPTFRLGYLRIQPTIETPEQVRNEDDQSYG
jgi:hypothetical protein